MDFHSVMETFAEAWVAANTHTPLTEAAEQGLINGPSNLSSNNFSLHAPSDNLNDRHESENPVDGYHGRQSPNDSQNGCTTLSELRPPLKNLSNPHEISRGKSMPVHCVVEQIPGPQACGQYVELDSYAILPSDTLFNELIRMALVKLGYSDKQILGAKGSIQIRNWKPLAFDQITENPEATLNDILGDLITVATLHIRLYSVPDDLQEWTDTTVRNAVLELLREMSQSKLAKLCPLSQPMLSNIINNRYMGKIGKEKCQEFGQWYLNYRKTHPEGSAPEIVPCDRPLDGRLTFHPTKELPIMREWFHSCRNPSRRTLQMYVDTLNQGPVRQQERPKVILSTLKNWWKNEKQRERKQKSDSLLPDNLKIKKKKNLENGIDPQREESCDGSLQSLDSSKSISEFNNMDESQESNSDVLRKKHSPYFHGAEFHKANSIHHHYIESHPNIVYHKLHPVPCTTPNQLVYNGGTDSFYSERESQKTYCNKLSDSRESNDDASDDHMCSDDVIIEV